MKNNKIISLISRPGLGILWCFICSTMHLHAESLQVVPFAISVSPYRTKNTEVHGLRLCLPFGDNRGVTGMDIGFVNGTDQMKGIQIGGLNATDQMKGIQIGVLNFANQLEGIQMGILFNKKDPVPWVNSSPRPEPGLAFQLSGFMNISFEDMVGLQVAPWGNGVDGEMKGLQIGGVGSWADQMRGVQVSLLPGAEFLQGGQIGLLGNFVEEEMRGFQIGFFNGTKNANGLQIGVVNYCRSMRGAQIGLVNIIRDNQVPFLPIINARF